MGGNVTAVTKSGKITRAEKIPLEQIGRSEFVAKVVEFLKELNNKFKKQTGSPIWKNESLITSGFIFNGSTSFIMDPKIKDSEVIKYKKAAGDLDITVPENLKEDLFNFLAKLEEKEIIPGVTYMGSNKPTLKSVGDQINTLFLVEFPSGTRAACQVDFEFLPYENDKPTEWAKFSHSSSFEDAKAGVKSVHHKYLLRALIGGASIRDDIIIATPKSTPDNIIPSKNKNDILPRMLKFSVGRGIRIAYQQMLDQNGKPVRYNGKDVYQEIPSKNSNFVTVVAEIFKLAFDKLDGKKADLKKFESFVGIIKLMKDYLNNKQIKATHDRYIQLLWGISPQRGQELEVQNPKLDFEVKNAGYQKFISTLKLRDESKKYIDKYYENYGTRKSKVTDITMFESFISYIDNKELDLFTDFVVDQI